MQTKKGLGRTAVPKSGESDKRKKMRGVRRRAQTSTVSASLLFVLLGAKTPGWGFKGKDGLKAQQHAWGALPFCAPQRHLISVLQTVVCFLRGMITAWPWAAYDIYHLPINIIWSWNNICAPTYDKKQRERDRERWAERQTESKKDPTKCGGNL